MQQQIRGWRFAAERTRTRRGARDVPAKMMGGVALMACRALSRMAMMGQPARSKRRGAGLMPARSRRSKGSTMPSMPSMPSLRSMQDMRAMQAQRASQAMQGMREMEPTTMKRVAGGMGMIAAGAGVAGWMAMRSRTGRTSKDREPTNRWIMVTINCSPQRLASRADLPEPITRLGDAVDIKICPAPGDRGTELGARLRELPRTKIAGMVMRRPEENPRHTVEQALREAKAIIEAGEPVRGDWPPPAQPAQVGKLLEFAGRRGGRP